MELKELVTLYRRWIWLLILGLLVGLVGGYVVSKMQKPVYGTSAKVLIARNRQQSAADPLWLSDQQLVSTYEKLLKTQPVLAEVESRLDTKLDPDRIVTQILPDTQIIQIGVQGGDAAQAAAIANSLVEVLIEQNETLQAGRFTTYEDGLSSQIAQVQEQIGALQTQITQINQANIETQLEAATKQIEDLQGQISTLDQDIASSPPTRREPDLAIFAGKQAQREQLRSQLSLYQQIQTNLTFIGKPIAGSASREDLRIASFQSTLNLYQQLYVNLLNNLETAKLAHAQSTPTVTLIEPAMIPEIPVSPKTGRNTALSAMLGLLLAAGLILLMDYFDDTLRTVRKVEEVLDAPVIGQITETGEKRKWYERVGMANQRGAQLDNALSELKSNLSRLMANSSQKRNWYERVNKANHRDAQLDIAFGDLRINLSRLMADRSQKRILVTSTTRGEGKTTVAANLANAFLQSGKKIFLVDADLYHPQLHKRLGIQNETGLTNILSGDVEWKSAAIKDGNLTVITAGTTSSSPSGFLESHDTGALLDKLQAEADVVIVDGPPLFVVDAQVLASQVGGVLLVTRQGETRIRAARSVARKLQLLDIHLYGIVLNGVAPDESNYYYDGYYNGAGDQEPQTQIEEHR